MTNDELYTLLKKIEWAAGETYKGGRCPYCLRLKIASLESTNWGHAENCKLYEALTYGVTG